MTKILFCILLEIIIIFTIAFKILITKPYLVDPIIYFFNKSWIIFSVKEKSRRHIF